MLEDQIFTGRQAVPQPGACLNCHASTYVTQLKLGNGDLQKGFDVMNKLSYHEAVKGVKHPVSCIDCHDSQSMQLRITKPAFMEGIKKYKATQGVQYYDVNKMATRQEMRSFVCAQCHVEYFFKGDEKRLTFPWDKGIKADEMLQVYAENGHKDWIHAETKAPVLKAQHPEFEMFSQGVHAKSGVSCVDCHMPYMRVGAMKITDHQARSPLLNINKSCQTCHHSPEAELLSKVELIQSRHLEMRDRTLNALIAFINDLKIALDKKIDPAKIKKAQTLQREAQFLVDFVEAENSAGFHAPQEAARLMVQAMDKIREGQLLLR
jgi:nitrite reductase (cytochrome c-552)